MTCAPAGIFTDAPAPTAEIFPFSITTTPFSITPCVMVKTFPPFKTTAFVCADAGLHAKSAANTSPAATREPKTENRALRTENWFIVPPDTAASQTLATPGQNKLHRQ